MTETYDFSNFTVAKNGNIFMGGTTLDRICSGICNPYFSYLTREFDLEELLISDLKQLTLFNTSLSIQNKELLVYAIRNLSAIYPNATVFSKLALFYINIDNLVTLNETFIANKYGYINIKGKEGIININATDRINISKVSIHPNTGDINIPGSILDELGQLHPCCGGNSINLKSAKISLNTPLSFDIFNGSSSRLDLDFGTSSTITGLLQGWNSSLFTFKIPEDGIYSFEGSLLLQSLTNITKIGCLYNIKDTSGTHKYYKFSQKYGSPSDMGDDGLFKYLECVNFKSTFLKDESITVDVYTTNSLNENQSTNASFILASSSYMMAIKD
jgi:hypothetical protein